MTGSLQVAVERDLDRALTIVTFTGGLSPAGAPRARSALLRCLAEYPLAIVVDLARLAVSNRAVLRLFPAAVRHRRRGPAVALTV